MSARSTEPLIQELVRDLQPVHLIPRIRVVVAGALVVWLVALVAHWLLGAPLPRLGPPVPWSERGFLAVLAGLSLTATGALVTALAGAVPGREGAARTSRAVALFGLGLALGGGLWAVATSAAPSSQPLLHASLTCLGRASALGILPALVGCAFLARSLARRPWLGAAFATGGSVALGAVAVHTSCTDGGALHMLLSHSLAPFLAAIFLAFPLAALVRSWRRRV